ncbi:TPA: lytic transglycosylase domain-containing protein [Citrobacter farmeri]|nr:lytic transglycosylase domain-containing protein [Citrobacter farmeri]
MIALTAAAGLSFALLFEQCAPDVSPVTLDAVIQTESAGNPYVVANVDDGTSHKFNSQPEATRFINSLSQQGKRFSAGLMQIYSGNFEKLGLDNNSVFDPCTNIKAGAKILVENFDSAKEGSEQERLKKSLSTYYSGNETRGFKKEPQYSNTSYVERVQGKVYKVPALEPDQQNQSRSATIDEPKKTPDQQWDLFGDFNNAP